MHTYSVARSQQRVRASSSQAAGRSDFHASRDICRDKFGSRVAVASASQKWDDVAIGMIDKYTGSTSKGELSKRNAANLQPQKPRIYLGVGVAFLLALNYGVFFLDNFMHHPIARSLPLVIGRWHWWQFVTYSFCHANFQHLANNLFMLWAFGRSIEEEEGVIGVIMTYLICAIGSAIAFALLNPHGVLVGASGAVFGMFVVSFLLKLRFSVRKLLELAAITPFVWSQLTWNVSAQFSGAGGNVAYMAHLAGAATGALLVLLLSLVPDVGGEPR